jgi:hypothetical protein
MKRYLITQLLIIVAQPFIHDKAVWRANIIIGTQLVNITNTIIGATATVFKTSKNRMLTGATSRSPGRAENCYMNSSS